MVATGQPPTEGPDRNHSTDARMLMPQVTQLQDYVVRVCQGGKP
jgi:hypothetical protein